MKKEFKLSKTWIVIFICLITLLLFAIGIYCLIPKERPQSKGEYYPANYEENIFLNQAYMDFQRDMIFSIGGVEQLFSYEKDYATAEPECQFFLKYFDTVINGDFSS